MTGEARAGTGMVVSPQVAAAGMVAVLWLETVALVMIMKKSPIMFLLGAMEEEGEEEEEVEMEIETSERSTKKTMNTTTDTGTITTDTMMTVTITAAITMMGGVDMTRGGVDMDTEAVVAGLVDAAGAGVVDVSIEAEEEGLAEGMKKALVETQ